MAGAGVNGANVLDYIKETYLIPLLAVDTTVDLGTLPAAGTTTTKTAQIDAVVNLFPNTSPKLKDLIKSISTNNLIVTKSNAFINNVPFSDELLSRMVSPLFVASKALPVTSNEITDNYVKSNVWSTMPESERSVYVAALNLNAEEKTKLKNYDEWVEKIRAVLSAGPVAVEQGIRPSNIITAPVVTTASVFNRYPVSVQAALRERRKSDPSNPMNPAALLGHIRVAMNGGATNMKGGNAFASSKAAPLYPRVVMHGGAYPLATMEGGAWEPTRPVPNPVALIDSRIKALELQFKSVTRQELDPVLTTQIHTYSDTINTTIGALEKDLNNLTSATQALSQYRPGAGVEINKKNLEAIAAQAKAINDKAAKASKQVDKMTQIHDLLEELVSKARPVGSA